MYPKIVTPTDALCRLIRVGRWRVLSITQQQAEELQKELDELGYVIVKKPTFDKR